MMRMLIHCPVDGCDKCLTRTRESVKMHLRNMHMGLTARERILLLDEAIPCEGVPMEEAFPEWKEAARA